MKVAKVEVGENAWIIDEILVKWKEWVFKFSLLDHSKINDKIYGHVALVYWITKHMVGVDAGEEKHMMHSDSLQGLMLLM